MTRRWIAWLLAAVAAVGTVVALDLAFDQGGSRTPEDWANLGGVIAFVAGFGAVGLVLALRRPDHAIGWLMVGFAAASAVRLACEYLLPVAADETTAWLVLVVNGLGGLQLALLVGAAIAFPGGIPKDGPWRVAFRVVWATVIVGFVTAPFLPYSDGDAAVSYPAPLRYVAVFDAFSVLSMFVLFGIGFAALIRLALLLFRGDPVVRHQIRWVAYVVLLAFGVLALTPLFPDRANVAAGVIAGVGIPVAVAVAVTRYRLYDIDRIVNRTVVYAIVVGLLGVVFAIGAVWLPSRLPFGDSNLAVAASTLAVFFLFNPLRTRTQRLVNRRFHRSRYDAQQVADDFSARLRDQVDPDAVTSEWVDVVQRTMHPESVAVWVRD